MLVEKIINLFTIIETPIETKHLGTTFPLLICSTGLTTSESSRKIKKE